MVTSWSLQGCSKTAFNMRHLGWMLQRLCSLQVWHGDATWRVGHKAEELCAHAKHVNLVAARVQK